MIKAAVRIVSVVLLTFVLWALSLSCATVPCADTPKAPESRATATVAPGVYEIRFLAIGGRQDGQSLVSVLHLYPVQGRTPGAYLAGWVESDLQKIGASPCEGDPSPGSRDPERPGVVVHREGDNTSYLTIGAVQNDWGSQLVEDGCGIVLYVDHAREDTLEGRWGRWGIVCTGAGTFTAKRIDE